jgi:hypothetical protein
MTAIDGHVYALEFRDGSTTYPAAPIEPDPGAIVEAARFAALRRGTPPEEAFLLPARIAPKWHGALGSPYVEALTVVAGAGDASASIDIPPRYFADNAREAIAALVEQGTVAVGTSLRYLVTAYPARQAVAGEGADPVGTDALELPVALRIREAPLGARLAGGRLEGPVHEDDVAVIVPASVLEDAKALATRADGVEAGAFLIGHLWRDSDTRDIRLEVTDLIPARHTRASLSSLTFTSETWWDGRAALALRGLQEVFLGWVHSHPVTRMCRSRGCPEAAQRRCAMAKDFFSDHDRLLHRTMFPRAFGLALVVNDWAFAPMSVSLFGYRAGSIEPRGFHVVDEG